jgi:hypothetical protein
MQGNVLVVGFDQEFADRKEFADRPRNIEVLQAKLREKLQMDVALKFEVMKSAAPASGRTTTAPGKAAEPAKKSLDEFKNDPLIKKALEIFKGTIVEVRK